MDDGDGEIREEARRVNDRFFAAVLLAIFTHMCKRVAGFDVSDPKTTKNGHMAFYLASNLNKMADLAFCWVINRIILAFLGLTFAPVVMRRLRQGSDVKLAVGSFCLMMSLFFLAYLRWFVVDE